MHCKCWFFAALCLLWIGLPSEAARICQSPSIQNYYHTWIHMTYTCKDQNPSDNACERSKPYTQWTDIGFESNSRGGGLRDESKNAKGVYECASWFSNDPANNIARGANAKQEREAIAGLVREGWATAPYNIIGGLTSAICDLTSSYKPRPNRQNVCWTFTCAYASYLKQVLKVTPRASGPSAFGVRDAESLQVPVAWTCNNRQYGSGDGCQCNCGAFDPDCDDMSAVATDCPNRDDVCIPGPENSAICKLRHQVSQASSVACLAQFFVSDRCIDVLMLELGAQLAQDSANGFGHPHTLPVFPLLRRQRGHRQLGQLQQRVHPQSVSSAPILDVQQSLLWFE
jgi:hypothetical protein